MINNLDSPPTLLRNVSGAGNHWVAFHLVGGPKSPRDATGATIYLQAGGMRQRADVVAGGSFASSSDPRPHFGLGAARQVDSVEIHWPSGTVERLANVAPDHLYTVIEGHGIR